MPGETRQHRGETGLAGRVALVTGAGRGIGRALALRLAREGALVVLADRDARACRETARDLARVAGRQGLAVTTDVSREEQVCSLLERVGGAHGGLDILVNNAGIAGPTAPVEEVSLEQWESTMAVNLRGVFLCCKHAVPYLKERGAGSIVNISSVSAKRPLPQRSPYAASKMALIGFTRTLASELGPWGIRVNAVCPGAVAGPRQEAVLRALGQRSGQSPDQLLRAKKSASPLGTLVQPEQVAALVAFLCSAQAEAITGQDINVSAGAVMY